MREIVLDTETTGLDPDQGHRLVEVAARRAGQPPADRPHLPQLPQPRARHARGGVPRPRAERRVPARLPGVRRGGRRRCSSSWATAGWSSTTPPSTCASSTPSSPATAASRWRPAARSTRCSWRSAAFPGAPNSLDALCRRFAVDNSARTRHGALLDCELLAEVYLHLIGGRQIGLGLDLPGQRAARCRRSAGRSARRGRTRPRPRSWPRTRPSWPSSTTRSGCAERRRSATRDRFAARLTAGLQALHPMSPAEARDAEDQGAEPDRRARRRRDDPDHLADDQGQADPALSRRRPALLRPRRRASRRHRRQGDGRGGRGDQAAQCRRQVRHDHARTRPG